MDADLEACLPAALRGPTTTIAKIAAGLSGAGVDRALTTLQAAVRRLAEKLPPARRADGRVRATALLEPIARACATVEPLHADETTLVEKILARTNVAVDDSAGAALLADIYRHPADDGPRAVYADWLIERGDPRGELIVLQLANQRPDRVATLIETYKDAICGSLAPFVERGYHDLGVAHDFADRCDVVKATPARPDPAWATVTDILGGMPATDACPMPVLRAAYGLDLAALRALSELAVPPPLEVMVWGNAAREDGDAERYYRAVAPRLPQRTKLGWQSTGATDPAFDPRSTTWLCAAPRLTELAVAIHPAAAARWLTWASKTELSSLVLGTRTCTARYVFDGICGWGIRVTHGWSQVRIVARVDRAVDRCDATAHPLRAQGLGIDRVERGQSQTDRRCARAAPRARREEGLVLAAPLSG